MLCYDDFTPAQNDAIDAIYGGNTLLIAKKGFGKAAIGQTVAQELIQDGELSHPVSEVTISLNLDQLLQRIDAVADDLDQRTAIASPTFRVSSMTLAGS